MSTKKNIFASLMTKLRIDRFRHPNLVTLMGYSAMPRKPRCLVYEYITNGTLEDALEIGVWLELVEA